jgi:hypothetical protein
VGADAGATDSRVDPVKVIAELADAVDEGVSTGNAKPTPSLRPLKTRSSLRVTDRHITYTDH